MRHTLGLKVTRDSVSGHRCHSLRSYRKPFPRFQQAPREVFCQPIAKVDLDSTQRAVHDSALTPY